MKRDRRGRFSDHLQPHQYAGFWVCMIALSIVGLTIGLQNAARFEVYAVASDLQAGSLLVQSEIVSSAEGRAKTMLAAGEPTPAPTATPETSAQPEALHSVKVEVMAYILEVFGDDADRAIAVAKCESGLRPNAINNKNTNGTIDHGIFQINSVHEKKRGSAFKSDWKANVRVAKQIFDEQGFRPWVCAKSIGEKNYLSK